jgi:hypothetical protein
MAFRQTPTKYILVGYTANSAGWSLNDGTRPARIRGLKLQQRYRNHDGDIIHHIE